MKFIPMDMKTLLVDIPPTEVSDLLRKSGQGKIEQTTIQDILIPTVFDVEEEKYRYRWNKDVLNVATEVTADHGLMLKIYGIDISDYNDNGDFEQKAERFLASIRWNNLENAHGMIIRFDSMDDVILFCKRLPQEGIKESMLFSMEGPYFLVIWPIAFCGGERS